jgi:multimeric flavodoxin WrbA
MHFISLIVSRRSRGNSEILGKLALKEAITQGAKGELVYLKDYNINECEGCMRCVFKNIPCHIKDDIYKLLDKISSASALFLSAPTYVLGIPGSLKLVMDRYLLIPKYFNKIYPRPAMSVGTCGLGDWNHFQLPLMNLFLLGLGFKIIDSFYARGAGPGEILLNEETIKRLKRGIKSMLIWKNRPFESQISSHCPVCFSTIFERVEGKVFRCPVCAVKAEEKEEGFYFQKDELNSHRWTPINVEDHFTNWILKTKNRFKQLLREIHFQKQKLNLK